MKIGNIINVKCNTWYPLEMALIMGSLGSLKRAGKLGPLPKGIFDFSNCSIVSMSGSYFGTVRRLAKAPK